MAANTDLHDFGSVVLDELLKGVVPANDMGHDDQGGVEGINEFLNPAVPGLAVVGNNDVLEPLHAQIGEGLGDSFHILRRATIHQHNLIGRLQDGIALGQVGHSQLIRLRFILMGAGIEVRDFDRAAGVGAGHIRRG